MNFKYNLEIIVFLTGAVVMVLELLASRILAPYMGNTIFTWTSLIGVIMASLALGYWLGGKIADRFQSYFFLFFVLLLSALTILFVANFQVSILNILGFSNETRLTAVLASVILFSLPSMLLGTVSPYAAKLKLANLSSSGSTVGTLYAISTTGSIAGTFLAGFYLIPTFGVKNNLIILAITLIVSVLFLDFKKTKLMCFLLLFFSVFSFFAIKETKIIETSYASVRIVETKDQMSGRPIRGLKTDPYGTQSAIFIDDKGKDLVSNYTKFYRLVDYFNPHVKKALMIGGGAFTYPVDFIEKHADATIDVVEIDPAMTEIAEQYFGFKPDQRIRIINADGRVFLNSAKDKYDVIFIDAFNSLEPPFNLSTVEAITKMKTLLTENGVIIANYISAVKGDKAKFILAEQKTYKTVFPFVNLYLPNGFLVSEKNAQNVMLVAAVKEEANKAEPESQELKKFLKSLYLVSNVVDLPILTDNYAPVEYYLKDLIR